MEANVAIRVQNARKVFGARPTQPLTRLNAVRPDTAGVVAVHDISFDVLHGEIFGLLGPNGSGKSTLMRLIAAVLAPDGGRISLFGHDTASESAEARAVLDAGALAPAFFKRLSPLENLL